MNQAQQDLLVLEAQNGNKNAFECLIIHFHPQLINFACNLSGNHELAKDAVQDVWFKMSNKLGKLDDPRAFKSWIFRALRWRVLDLIKAKSYKSQPLEGTELSVELDESLIERRQIRKLIQKLPEQERSVIYLFYLADLPLADIAQILDIPIGTVKSRLNRSRAKLQQQLK